VFCRRIADRCGRAFDGCRVGRLSTFAPGDEESVFAAVRAAFDAAKSFGPTVMVVTLSSGLPSEETVAEIQGASHG